MKTVKLITCSDAAQAHIIQGALENEGISSLLHNENMSTLLRGYINDIAGVDVWVDEADYEAAVRLLEQNEMIPEQLINSRERNEVPIPSTMTTIKPSSAREVMYQLYGMKVLGTYWSPGPW